MNGSIKHGFANACARAELGDVTPHTSRHTAVTRMLQAEVPIWEAAVFASMTVKLIGTPMATRPRVPNVVRRRCWNAERPKYPEPPTASRATVGQAQALAWGAAMNIPSGNEVSDGPVFYAYATRHYKP
jgi:hypothetical protein